MCALLLSRNRAVACACWQSTLRRHYVANDIITNRYIFRTYFFDISISIRPQSEPWAEDTPARPSRGRRARLTIEPISPNAASTRRVSPTPPRARGATAITKRRVRCTAARSAARSAGGSTERQFINCGQLRGELNKRGWKPADNTSRKRDVLATPPVKIVVTEEPLRASVCGTVCNTVGQKGKETYKVY